MSFLWEFGLVREKKKLNAPECIYILMIFSELV